MSGFDRSGHLVFLSRFDPETGSLSSGSPSWFKVVSVYDDALVGVMYQEEGKGATFKEIRRHSQPHFFRSHKNYIFIRNVNARSFEETDEKNGQVVEKVEKWEPFVCIALLFVGILCFALFRTSLLLERPKNN